MFFFLSKTVSILIQPLIIVMLLLLASVLSKPKRLRKIFFWSGLGLLIFFSNSFISSEVMRVWEIEATPFDEVGHYDIGIVLTGVTESKVFPGDRVYFSKGADRVFHAFQLYRQGRIKKILISGGTGSLLFPGEEEALKLKRVFNLLGVPDSNLIVESESRNTHENAVFSTKIINASFNEPRCLLITSAAHMRRARACFQKTGLVVDVFSTDFRTDERKIGTWIIFDLGGLLKWTTLFKEWAGYIAYGVAGYI